jgi:hypothetical protein
MPERPFDLYEFLREPGAIPFVRSRPPKDKEVCQKCRQHSPGMVQWWKPDTDDYICVPCLQRAFHNMRFALECVAEGLGVSPDGLEGAEPELLLKLKRDLEKYRSQREAVCKSILRELRPNTFTRF